MVQDTKTFDHRDPTDSAVDFMENKHKTKPEHLSHRVYWISQSSTLLFSLLCLFLFLFSKDLRLSIEFVKYLAHINIFVLHFLPAWECSWLLLISHLIERYFFSFQKIVLYLKCQNRCGNSSYFLLVDKYMFDISWVTHLQCITLEDYSVLTHRKLISSVW